MSRWFSPCLMHVLAVVLAFSTVAGSGWADNSGSGGSGGGSASSASSNSSQETTTSAADIIGNNTLTKYSIGNTMNFDSCLDYKIEICRGTCGIGKVGIPVPGVRFKYKEPSGLVETTCRHGMSELDKNSMGLAKLMGTGNKPNTQKCIEPTKIINKGEYRKWYYDVHVYGITPISRYQSSGSIKQATASLTCGILGKIGFLMNLANFLGGFSLSNFSLSNITQSIQNSIQNTINNIVNLPQNLVNSIQGTLQNIANLPQNLMNSVSNIATSFQNLGSNLTSAISNLGTSLQSISELGSNLSSLGNSLTTIANLPGASLIPGMSSIASAGQLFSSAGGTMNLAATGLANAEAIGNEIMTSVEEGLMSIQDFMETTVGDFESAFGTMDAVGFTGGDTSQAMLALNYWATHMNDASSGLGVAVQDEYGGTPLFNDVQIAQANIDYHETGTLNTAYGQIDFANLDQSIQQGEDGGNGLQVEGMMLTGASQQAMQAATGIYARLKDTLESGSAFFVNLANRIVTRTDEEKPAAACDAWRQVTETKEKIKGIKELLPGYKTETVLKNGPFFPRGTYLGAASPQMALEDRPVASCPLTHAGYVFKPQPQTIQGYSTEMVNCHYVCKKKRDGSKDCRMAPLPGLGGNCLTNQLSTMKVEGRYPSCNGWKALAVANPEGDMVATRGGYDRGMDHLRELNLGLVTNLENAAATADRNIAYAIGKLEPLVDKKSCTITKGQSLVERKEFIPVTDMGEITFERNEEKGYTKMTTKTVTEENGATVERTHSTYKYDDIPPSNSGGGGSEKTNTNSNTGSEKKDNWTPIGGTKNDVLIKKDTEEYKKNSQEQEGANKAADTANSNLGGGIMNTLDTLDAVLRSGGLKQIAGNMVMQYLPFGLTPAFRSEVADWSEPPFSIQSVLANALNQLAANSPLYLVCTIPQIAQDFGASSGLTAFTQKYCKGIWGMSHPKTGWAHNQFRPVAAAMIGARGWDQAVALKGVKPNTKGSPQFNLDYPYINSASPFSQAAGFDSAPKGGKHKGSGCYDVGTSKQGWFTAGEKEIYDPRAYIPNVQAVTNPNLQAELEKGYYLFTYWKRTACCVYFCKGPQVKREY